MTRPPLLPETNHPVQVETRSIELIQAIRALVRGSRILERASSDLNLAHYRVLAAIASGEERASRVAARLALGKPTVSAAVDSLRQRGLLVGSDVASDHRATGLSLTAEGEAVLDRVEAKMADALMQLVARTSDSERLIECLAWLGTAIDEMQTERFAKQATSS